MIRRIVTAVLVPAVLVSTLVSDPPWSAAEADPPKLILLATFGAEHAYVAFAMGDTTGVGARADGKLDVIRPLAEGVAETYEVGPEPLTSIALSEVSGRTVAVAGSDGAARIIDLGNGSELCRIDAPDHFAEMATGTSGGRPVVISGRSGGFGVWDAGSCVSHGRFDVAATGDGDIGILTLDGSAAAVFADDSGVTRGFDLSTGTATGERTSLPGRPALAVTALGKRLSVWDTATGSEKTRVDLDTPVRDGSLAVLRAGERLLAATVDEAGTLRVCDLDSGEEVGEYQFGLTESPPLLGFTGDGEPRLVFTSGGQIAVFGL